MNELSTEEIVKYSESVPRYTSYPPANYFRDVDNSNGYIKAIQDSNQSGLQNLSFYFHIPFCPHRCLFCGCQTEIGARGDEIRRYFKALHQELDQILPYIDTSRPLTQVHFGGGTPNAVPAKELAQVLDRLKIFKWSSDAEIALEADPALINEKRLSQYREMGFTRISYGIQDTNEEILDIVERKPSQLPLKELIQLTRDLGFRGINIDLIYGLPEQTLAQFTKSVQEVVDARPDRVSCFGYAHIPWMRSQQQKLEPYRFPTPVERVDIFHQTIQTMTEGGYEFIGLDHFALPDDDLSIALSQGQLHRNFQGYCSRAKTGQVYGFGASAIGQLEGGFYQNLKNSLAYVEAIESGQLPLEKQLPLGLEERFYGDAIVSLMCNLKLDYQSLAQSYDMSIEEVKARFGFSQEKWDDWESEGFLIQGQDGIQATSKGRWVIRNLASSLDPLMVDRPQGPQFSQSL